MISYAFNRGVRYEYQLRAVIALFGILDHDEGHSIAFVRVFGQWIRFDDSGVQAINESAALGVNFPETAASSQTASILLSVLNTTEEAIL
jgi:ubiquitin C-terminal hydrolase